MVRKGDSTPLMVLRPSAPQAGASANSATSAREAVFSRQFSVLSFQPSGELAVRDSFEPWHHDPLY